MREMEGSYAKVLLVSANVGSIFEDVSMYSIYSVSIVHNPVAYCVILPKRDSCDHDRTIPTQVLTCNA